MADYFDHIVVGKLEFKNGVAEIAAPANGLVKGVMTLPAGTTQQIASQPAAPSQTSQTAGASYTSNEQNMLNALKAQVNALTTALKNAGHLQ